MLMTIVWRLLSIACTAVPVYTEARGESSDGMDAVAAVVIERARRSGSTACSVVFQRHQFSVLVSRWEASSVAAAWAAAVRVHSAPTSTGCVGATHFDSNSGAAWTRRLRVLCRIGGHTFYGPPA